MRFRRSSAVIVAAAVLAITAAVLMRAQAGPDDPNQLVAPVALYPDELVAAVLAASTFPEEVDDAAHWLQQNASLSPDQVATAVDKMEWDDSVKSLTEFPAVLAMMDQNLSWTSALGDAYYNDPDAVLDAVQALRQRAISAGTLQSNDQITVTTSDGEISIEPAAADTIYVPSYDDWAVYGAPIAPWPEFVEMPGFVPGPHVRWSTSIHLGGVWGRVNWGWHNWHSDWRQRRVTFRRDVFVSHSPSVIDRHVAPRVVPRVSPPNAERREPPGLGRGGQLPIVGKAVPGPKPVVPPKPPVDHRENRGIPKASEKVTPPPTGTRGGAFGGISHGGQTTQSSARGRASMEPHPAPASTPAKPPARAGGSGRGRGGL